MAKRKTKKPAAAKQTKPDEPFKPKPVEDLEAEAITESTPDAEPEQPAAGEQQEPAQAVTVAAAAEPPEPFRVTYGVASGLKYITLRLPLGPPAPAGYCPRKMETRLDSQSLQPLALRRLFDGFQAEHAQLASGKHVDSYAEAVRKLLELIAQACEPTPPAAAPELDRAA